MDRNTESMSCFLLTLRECKIWNLVVFIGREMSLDVFVDVGLSFPNNSSLQKVSVAKVRLINVACPVASVNSCEMFSASTSIL